MLGRDRKSRASRRYYRLISEDVRPGEALVALISRRRPGRSDIENRGVLRVDLQVVEAAAGDGRAAVLRKWRASKGPWGTRSQRSRETRREQGTPRGRRVTCLRNVIGSYCHAGLHQREAAMLQPLKDQIWATVASATARATWHIPSRSDAGRAEQTQFSRARGQAPGAGHRSTGRSPRVRRLDCPLQRRPISLGEHRIPRVPEPNTSGVFACCN